MKKQLVSIYKHLFDREYMSGVDREKSIAYLNHPANYSTAMIANLSVVKYLEFLDMSKVEFNVVLGNPPYQKPTNTEKDENNRQGSFWWEIVCAAKPFVKEGGVLAMVIPTSIFSTGGFGKSTHKVTQLRTDGFELSNVWSNVNQHFDVGISISAFTAIKGTASTCNIVDKNQSVSLDYDYTIPFTLDKETISIVKKCYNSKNKWKFKEVDSSEPTDKVVKINGGRYKQYSKLFVGKSQDTDHRAQTMILNADDDLNNVSSAFMSKIFKFMFVSLGGENGQSSTGILQSLPFVDISRNWTDQDLYAHFNLTEEEIEYIEANIK